MKYRIVLGLVLLMSVTGMAQDQPTGSPTPLIFGDAHLAVPPGWKHVETHSGANQAKVLLIVPPGNSPQKNLAVLVLPGQDLGDADFPQAFDAILKQALAPNEHQVQSSDLPLRKTAGYDFLTRSMVVADEAGHRSVRICFGANPNHRLEMLIVSADSKETLARYQAEISSLLGSYSFGDAPVPAEAANQESGATTAPARAESGASAAQSSPSEPSTNPERGGPGVVKAGAGAARAHVADGESVLLCTDPVRLDGAMDFAKYGDSYNALRALRNDAFFRVNGPATLEVKASDLKSRWPKVLVTVLDGDLAGRTGWVVRSELKDLKLPAGK